MIKSIVREHHWSPKEINGLYLDSTDHFGLEYWYDDVVQVHNDLKAKK